MTLNKLKYVFATLLIISCSDYTQNYSKYDALNFTYKNFLGNELNSFENKYYYLYNGKYLIYDANIGTVDKIKLLDVLKRTDYFDIADSINFNINPSSPSSRYPSSKLYIRHYGFEKEIKWNTEVLKDSKYKTKIEQIVNVLNEIKRENLRYIELPRGRSIL